jgi:hypothetical protein
MDLERRPMSTLSKVGSPIPMRLDQSAERAGFLDP